MRKRSGSSALKQMRREGLTPAVLYGAGVENVNLKVVTREFSTLLHHAAGENLLVHLDIEGESGEPQMALIQAVQHDPITSSILHADFHAVRANEKIHANVPLELTGTAAGVKAGGVLQHQVHSLEVHCFPKDLPETIEADVSGLELGDAMHVGDLVLPDGVEAALEDDVVVAIVSEPKVADLGEEGEEGEESLKEPEVTSEKASEDEEETSS